MEKSTYGILVLIGGALYGTMSSFIKLFYSRGYNAAELSFSQALLAAIFLGIFLFVKGKHAWKLSRKEFFSLLVTGGAIGLTNFLYYKSVGYISASLAIVVLMQFTWFSLLLEWGLFRKKPSKPEFVTVLFILVGTVMAGNLLNTEAAAVSVVGIALALLSSITYAAYIVTNSSVGTNVSWLPKSTVIMTGSALSIFVINARTIITDNHVGPEFLAIAVFLAVVGTTIPTALFAAGIPRLGAGISSILMTIELPVALICARFVLGERINFSQAVGILIMLAAISFMNYHRSSKTD